MHIGSTIHMRQRHRAVSNVMTVDHNAHHTRSCDSALVNSWNNTHGYGCSMTRTIICCIRQINPYISNDGRRSYRPLHPVSPTGWPRRRKATGSAEQLPQACAVHGRWVAPSPCMPSAGHSRSAAGCEATGGTGRIVRALAPHTDSRGGTLSARCREGTCNTGRAGTGQVPSSALFCGDNRQTHLGGRGPPGCSGERDRWLSLGSDDLNARTRA